MPGERPSPQPKESKDSLISEIYRTPPTAEEKSLVDQTGKDIVKDSDVGGVALYKELRDSLKDLDSDEGWKEAKEKAREELKNLPPDALEQLVKKFSPFIKNLPAGHGKGHLFRDAIHLTGMFQDPEFSEKKMDEVEMAVGILGGMFHDIGNSIVSRYDDAKRLGAHAEVGSTLFGRIAKDTLPPHLLKLTQYAIAAHTHYPSQQEVTLPNGEKVKRQDYNDKVSESGDRLSMWITRQTDRRDTSNLAFLFRNYLLRTKPVQDFNGKEFDQLKGDEENFKIQYSTDPEFVNQKGVLTHSVNFAKNVFDSKVPYTTHDSNYFTRHLMTPGLADFALFLDVVAPGKLAEMLDGIEKNEKEAMASGKWPVKEGEMPSAQLIKGTVDANHDQLAKIRDQKLTPDQIRQSVEGFIAVAQTIEPAGDLKSLTNALRLQFLGGEVERDGKKEHIEPLLSPQSQEILAKGFQLLIGPLRDNWLGRLREEIKDNPDLGKKTKSEDPAIQQALGNMGTHLQSLAQQELAVLSVGSSSQGKK